jgi:hypothetical protein
MAVIDVDGVVVDMVDVTAEVDNDVVVVVGDMVSVVVVHFDVAIRSVETYIFLFIVFLSSHYKMESLIWMLLFEFIKESTWIHF